MSLDVFFQKTSFSGTPLEAYRVLKGVRPAVLLESARLTPGQGRYSLAASDPAMIFEYKNGRLRLSARDGKKSVPTENPLAILKSLLREKSVPRAAGFPPFAGGAVGFAGYEAKKLFEPTLAGPPVEDLGLPWLYFLFLEEGLLFDHQTGENHLFCVSSSAAAAARRHRFLEMKLKARPPKPREEKKNPKAVDVVSSVTKKQFVAMVEAAQRHIRVGDIFQANLSQRFTFPLDESVEAVYEKLKKVNPSSFFGILDAGDFRILSGSPERLLKLDGNRLETRPISGTRPRDADVRKDRAVSRELLLNEKERAEHIMLVDLERNYLGRVAEYGSVRVNELMTVEDYSHVKHIVSGVTAVLKKGLHAVDAFSAFFPGGTITGAPKVRAMEIIDELEPVARGPYTGSLGYFSFTGDMDFNIIIRSLVVKDGLAHLQVGAGIVADSDPGKEYDETLYKAEAVLTALFGVPRTRELFRKFRAS